jgi:hypothetical protein
VRSLAPPASRAGGPGYQKFVIDDARLVDDARDHAYGRSALFIANKVLLARLLGKRSAQARRLHCRAWLIRLNRNTALRGRALP